MRILLVSIAIGEDEFAIEKVEVDRIMPHSFENNTSTPFAMETIGDLVPRERGPPHHSIIGRQPEEHPLRASESNPAYPPIMQAVKNETAFQSAPPPGAAALYEIARGCKIHASKAF